MLNEVAAKKAIEEGWCKPASAQSWHAVRVQMLQQQQQWQQEQQQQKQQQQQQLQQQLPAFDQKAFREEFEKVYRELQDSRDAGAAVACLMVWAPPSRAEQA